MTRRIRHLGRMFYLYFDETVEGLRGNARPSSFVLSEGDKKMKNNTSNTFWHSAMVLIASVFALNLTGGSAVLAAEDAEFGSHKIFVSGNSTFSDCGGPNADFAMLLTGDLEGCLSVFVKRYKCMALNDHDLYWESGREVFQGDMNGESGKFTTRYTFHAAYAPGFCESFDFSLEVGGGCVHEVWGDSGVFRKYEGVITFIDVIAGVTGDPVSGTYMQGLGANNFLYSGHLQRKYRLDVD